MDQPAHLPLRQGRERPALGVRGDEPEPPVALRLVAALVVILAVCMISMSSLNVAIERFAYRPLRHAPRLAPLITAIGVSFILQNVVQIWSQATLPSGPYLTPAEPIEVGDTEP